MHRVRHDWSNLACMHALEIEMATHSSVLAWRISGTEEPGGLPSMASCRARHDWSDLAAAASALRPSLVPLPWPHLSPVQGTFWYCVFLNIQQFLAAMTSTLLILAVCSARNVRLPSLFPFVVNLPLPGIYPPCIQSCLCSMPSWCCGLPLSPLYHYSLRRGNVALDKGATGPNTLHTEHTIQMVKDKGGGLVWIFQGLLCKNVLLNFFQMLEI